MDCCLIRNPQLFAIKVLYVMYSIFSVGILQLPTLRQIRWFGNIVLYTANNIPIHTFMLDRSIVLASDILYVNSKANVCVDLIPMANT